MEKPKLFFFDVRNYGPQAQVVAYTEEEARGYLLAEKKPVDQARLEYLGSIRHKLQLKAMKDTEEHPNYRNPKVVKWMDTDEYKAIWAEYRAVEAEWDVLWKADYHNREVDSVLEHPPTVYEIGVVSWTEVS